MNKWRRLSFLLFFFAAIVPASPGEPAGEIRAVMKAQEEAWNRGDIDGFMNGYARSSSTTFV